MERARFFLFLHHEFDNHCQSRPSFPVRNQTDNRTAAQATAHPELFRDTYWGCFTIAGNPSITPAVIRNRNAFVTEWRIKARSHAYIPHPRPIEARHDYDHSETYRDADGWLVLLVSNYGDGIPPPPILGMKRIAPLYSTDATTYAGRYATLKELRARLEAACTPAGSPFAVALG